MKAGNDFSAVWAMLGSESSTAAINVKKCLCIIKLLESEKGELSRKPLKVNFDRYFGNNLLKTQGNKSSLTYLLNPENY